MVRIDLPRALDPYAGGETTVMLDEPCLTVRDAFTLLHRRSPGVVDRVLNERGEVRPHVNVFVDGESIRFREGLATRLSGDSAILIVAAVSGG